MPTVGNVCARLRHTLKVEIASQQNRQLILIIIIIINAVNNKKTKLIKSHKIFHYSFARFRLQHNTCSRLSVPHNNSLPKVNDEINVQFKKYECFPKWSFEYLCRPFIHDDNNKTRRARTYK